MTHYQLTRYYLAAIVVVFALLATFIVYSGQADAKGNPPGTTCTGYRYGKGGSKVCIRWTYPTTTTVAP